jgi:hypothetical protein
MPSPKPAEANGKPRVALSLPRPVIVDKNRPKLRLSNPPTRAQLTCLLHDCFERFRQGDFIQSPDALEQLKSDWVRVMDQAAFLPHAERWPAFEKTIDELARAFDKDFSFEEIALAKEILETHLIPKLQSIDDCSRNALELRAASSLKKIVPLYPTGTHWRPPRRCQRWTTSARGSAPYRTTISEGARHTM